MLLFIVFEYNNNIWHKIKLRVHTYKKMRFTGKCWHGDCREWGYITGCPQDHGCHGKDFMSFLSCMWNVMEHFWDVACMREKNFFKQRKSFFRGMFCLNFVSFYCQNFATTKNLHEIHNLWQFWGAKVEPDRIKCHGMENFWILIVMEIVSAMSVDLYNNEGTNSQANYGWTCQTAPSNSMKGFPPATITKNVVLCFF